MIVEDKKVLRQMSKEWTGTHEELAKLVEKMYDAMKEAKGIGISAIQVGVPVRVFLAGDPEELFINPKVTYLSSYKKKNWEGCLSCPNVNVQVPRSHKIHLTYTTLREGKEVLVKDREFKYFDAFVVQHELDHLNGRLIEDRGKAYTP